jgi:hypothetical protein
MSRNLQRKSTATPARKTVQKSSIPTDDSSDDDGYEGVDQISDSEEDEPDVEAAEEDVIRAFEKERLTPRPESDDEESVEDLPSPSFFTDMLLLSNQITPAAPQVPQGRLIEESVSISQMMIVILEMTRNTRIPCSLIWTASDPISVN